DEQSGISQSRDGVFQRKQSPSAAISDRRVANVPHPARGLQRASIAGGDGGFLDQSLQRLRGQGRRSLAADFVRSRYDSTEHTGQVLRFAVGRCEESGDAFLFG